MEISLRYFVAVADEQARGRAVGRPRVTIVDAAETVVVGQGA